MNKIILMGRLAREIELNQNGKIATSSIAVDRVLKDAAGNKVTDFIPLRWIGERKAQFAFDYLHKGMKILVEGNMHIDQYKNDAGNNRSYCYVLVDNTEFAESKRNASPEGTTQENSDGFMNIPGGIDEELPFN